jgi:hypothetical protein
LAARHEQEATVPVPAGTVIQQGLQQEAPPATAPAQAEATDRGPTDMEVTEGGNGNNTADGVDFNP